jgi:hypothetical protein
MSDEAKVEPTENDKLTILKSTAVRQAMCEVISEQRDEILTRARAKLTAMGVSIQDSDIEPTL